MWFFLDTHLVKEDTSQQDNGENPWNAAASGARAPYGSNPVTQQHSSHVPYGSNPMTQHSSLDTSNSERKSHGKFRGGGFGDLDRPSKRKRTR